MKSAALDLRDWGGSMNCSAVPSWCGVRKLQILAQDCASLGGVIPINQKKKKKLLVSARVYMSSACPAEN